MQKSKKAKELTYVKRNGVTIHKYDFYVPINTVITMLRLRDISGKVDVQYAVKYFDKLSLYGCYLIKDFKKMGVVFPYGSFQNSNL